MAKSRIAIDYAFQELAAIPPTFVVPPGRSRPWGTAQAALVAADAIAGPFAVINADDFYGRQTFHLLADHLRGGSTDYAMAAYPLRATLSPFGTVSRGVCEVDSDGLLRAIVERTGIAPDGAIAGSELLGGDTLVSMNIWGFTPAIFPRLRDYFAHFLTEHGTDLKAEAFLPTFMDELIAVHRARVRVLQSADAWFGITYRADLPRVRERVRALIAAGDYPERLA